MTGPAIRNKKKTRKDKLTQSLAAKSPGREQLFMVRSAKKRLKTAVREIGLVTTDYDIAALSVSSSRPLIKTKPTQSRPRWKMDNIVTIRSERDDDDVVNPLVAVAEEVASGKRKCCNFTTIRNLGWSGPDLRMNTNEGPRRRRMCGGQHFFWLARVWCWRSWFSRRDETFIKNVFQCKS